MPPTHFYDLCICQLFLLLLLICKEQFAEGFQGKPMADRTGSYNTKGPTTIPDDLEKIRDPVLTRASFLSSAAVLLATPTEVQAASPSSTVPPKQQTASEPSSLQESISGFIAGASLAATKTLVKYPLDTATVRLQMPNSKYSITDIFSLFGGSYNGITLSLLSNIPGGAVFFAVKDATKASLRNSAFSTSPKWITTSIAVGVALLPYWIVRNPSEVIKVRQQAGVEGYGSGVSAIDAVKLTLAEASSNGTTFDGIKEFYSGYGENIIYGFPADVIKFVSYEAFTGGRRDLTPLEGARAGAFATALAQFITTPFDVIRNRLMSGKGRKEGQGLENYLQSLVTLAQEEGFSGLFAGSSPRVAKAFLSGAIQFATYEETKQSIVKLLQR